MCKIIALSLAFFLASINCLKAEQLLGVSITYRNIGSLKYEVNYSVYIDRFVRNKLDTTTFKPLTFMVYSGKASVTNFPNLVDLDTFKFGCAGILRIGILKKYKDTIDLNASNYNAIKTSGNCRTYFGCKYPERYLNLKNLPAAAYFTYAFVNTCNVPNNISAVALVYQTIYYLGCVNKPTLLSFSASDTSNFDSISYRLINPLKDFDSPIAYLTPYTNREQIDPYWPVGYDKLLGPNQYSNPPIGFSTDTIEGSFIFTPITFDSEYSLSNEMIEHKMIGGKYFEAGGIHNDFVIRITECPVNSPPILYGPFSHIIDAGQQICFTVKSDDKQFIPPPPQKQLPPDSVRLIWNRGIPGATFTIVDRKERLQQGKFCWTPKLTQFSNLPYSFTVTAIDNACPFQEITVRTYSIKVNEPVNSISISNPQNIIISPNPSSNGELNISCDNFKFNEIALIDITGKQLIKWEFEQTDKFSKDLSYLTPGVYFIKCKNGAEVYNLKWIRE